MNIIPLLIPILRTNINVGLSCSQVWKWMSANGFKPKANKGDLCRQNVEFFCYPHFNIPRSQFAKYAALNGDIPLLKWLRENDYRLDRYVSLYAAQGGQLEVLKWLVKNKVAWHPSCDKAAANEGHLEILKWLHENEGPLGVEICNSAAFGGQLEVLKWAVDVGRPWNKEVCVQLRWATYTS